MRERNYISLLGMDTRPLARQAPAGLCEDITNLRPAGSKEDPHWEAVSTPLKLKNSDGVAFDHPNKDHIIGFYLQSSTVERLILVFDDGTIDLVNPDSWNVVSHYTFGEESTQFDVQFAPAAEFVAVAISKGDTPFKLLYVYKNEIVPYGFPILPSLLMVQVEVEEPDDTKVANGLYDGLDDGFYAYRYGFRLSDGSNVCLSPPLPFEVSTSGDNYFNELQFTLGGYNAQNPPDNYSFWKELFTGIDVYLSDRHDQKKEVLLHGLFYKVASFNTIDRNDELDLNTVTYRGKYEDIPTNELFEVDDGSFHQLAAKTIHSYNSRLLLGNVSIDFVDPPISIYSFISDEPLIVMSPVEYKHPENGRIRGGGSYSTDEDLNILNAVFTITAINGGVLPYDAVSVTNIENGKDLTKAGEGDTRRRNSSVVEITILVENTNSGAEYYAPGGPLSFDISAQAYDTLDMITTVGEAFTTSYLQED